MTESEASGGDGKPQAGAFENRIQPFEVRLSNIRAAKAVADAIRTSLGPRGMDKMIQRSSGDVTITNDGATILKEMGVVHPAAKMLVELAKAQDIEAGDGTTTVVIIAGALLKASEQLMSKGVHPSSISDSFRRAAREAVEILDNLSTSIDTDPEALSKCAQIALNSKVVAVDSVVLGRIAANAVLKITDPANKMCNLNDIKIVKKLGGTIEDTELIEGLVLSKPENVFGPRTIRDAKIGLIQFAVARPSTDMDQQVIVTNYNAMDRIIKEERMHVLNIVKTIKMAGCNVLFVQKSVLRDSVSELGLHFLQKANIAVVKDVDPKEVEFISKTLNCRPIASLDHFVPKSLASADLMERVVLGDSSIVKITGIQNMGKTLTILVRGSSKLLLDEAERSLHDALCTTRCLMRKGASIPGGGVPEIEISGKLRTKGTKDLTGLDTFCFPAFADALEVIPFTLAENAGLDPVRTVTELRNRHALNESTAGISVQKGAVADILEENVIQPLLVATSSITLATETVSSILRIDGILCCEGESSN